MVPKKILKERNIINKKLVYQMGKTSKSVLGVRTGSSPQGSLSQGNVDAKVKVLTKKLKTHYLEQSIFLILN